MKVEKDRIVSLVGSWHSGLATLVLENGEVFCDNGATVRALDAAYGNVIGEGHSIDNVNGGHVGKEIYYSLDEMGMLLEAFTPVEEASEELINIYEKERSGGDQ
jgi:hypothetical protein